MALPSSPAAQMISLRFCTRWAYADLLGWATIAVEIVSGLLVLFGAFVPVAALPMIIVLLVAIVTVHLPNGFSSIKLVSYDSTGAHFGQPGYETDLLYLAGLLALCIGGAGPLSLDGYLSARRKRWSHGSPQQRQGQGDVAPMLSISRPGRPSGKSAARR
jgi:putative oxidoreductase